MSMKSLLRFSRWARKAGLVFAGLVCLASWARPQNFSACDLNQDGLTDATDVTLAVKMALGTALCTANVEGPLTCTVVTVQRVFDASQGQSCATYNSLSGHRVTLTWVASISLNVTGYN